MYVFLLYIYKYTVNTESNFCQFNNKRKMCVGKRS